MELDESQTVRKCYFDPSEKNIKILISYLHNLGDKSLKSSAIRRCVLKNSWKEKELPFYHRANIQSAAKYAQVVMNKYEGKISQDSIKSLIGFAQNSIKYKDANQDLSFFAGIGSNVLPDFVHFGYAKNLFYHNYISKNELKRSSIDLVVIYIMRLSLEQAIFGLLSVSLIKSNNGRPLGFSKLYNIVRALKNVEYTNDISWDEIELVNKFLNHHIHRHFQPAPWLIQESIEVLNPLIGLRTHKENGKFRGGHWGKFAATTNKSALKKEIDSLIKEMFNPSEIWWFGEPKVFEINEKEDWRWFRELYKLRE